MRCFEKFLTFDPHNKDVLKILNKLYTESEDQEKKDSATKYFKKVSI